MRRSAAALLSLMIGLAVAVPALCATTPDPTAEPGAIVLEPGSHVDLTLGDDGAPQVSARRPASADELAALPHMRNDAETLTPMALKVAPPKPGLVSASLWWDVSRGAILKVDDGLGFALSYHAFLILEQDGRRTYRETSVCPVRAGAFGVESWAEHVVGVVLTRLTRAEAPLTCTDGSLLSVTSAPPSGDRYVCNAGQGPTDAPSSLTVSLLVDANGGVLQAGATWWLGGPDMLHQPRLAFNYPLSGDTPGRFPNAASVVAAMSATPLPAAATASIVLALNGVEKARRPWNGYAQNRAAPPPPGGKRPVAYVGFVPFNASPDPAANAGFSELLAGVGRPGATVQVIIVGDDGVVLEQADYPVAGPGVADKAALDAALAEALAKAKTLTQCQKLQS